MLLLLLLLNKNKNIHSVIINFLLPVQHQDACFNGYDATAPHDFFTS